MSSRTTIKLQADVDEKRELVAYYSAARRRMGWSLVAAGVFAVTVPPVAVFLPAFVLFMWFTMLVICLISFWFNSYQYPSHEILRIERRLLLQLERLLCESYLIDQRAEGLGMEL